MSRERIPDVERVNIDGRHAVERLSTTNRILGVHDAIGLIVTTVVTLLYSTETPRDENFFLGIVRDVEG